MSKSITVNKKDVFIGIFTMSAVWLAGTLFSGKIYGGDELDFSDGIPVLSAAFPMLLLLFVISISVFAKRCRKTGFFIAVETLLLIPMVSLLLVQIFIPTGGATNIVFGVVGMIFMCLQIPFTSCVSGFSSAFGELAYSQTYINIFAVVLFIAAAGAGLASYLLTKEKLNS